jgi:hypothetical protein
MTKNYRKSLSKKFDLSEEIQLSLYGKLHYKSLDEWIRLHPNVVYNHLYLPGKLFLVKITITKTAYLEFKKSLATLYPELFKQMIEKQLKAQIVAN